MAQTAPMAPPGAALRRPFARIRTAVPERGYALAVLGSTAAAAAFLAARLTAWPPHEDETLALFVGQGSLGSVLDTVVGDRGGAPFHFLLAWVVEHTGGGLTGLRVLTAIFAVASVPLVAALGSRLADRTVGALAAALAATSWVLLFHGIYARMYSLFLLTSLLSYLALLAALRRGGARRWVPWGVATLLMVATHPYGALVLASQGLYVLFARERVREALAAFGVVGVLGVPFWITDLVLAGRFDVAVGSGDGNGLGGVGPVIRYLAEVAADFSAGPVALPVVLVLAGIGVLRLARANARSAVLVGIVFGTPTAAFLVARLGGTAAPETRHLIFALPFFATLVAAGVVAAARSGRPGSVAAAGLAAVVILGGGLGWTYEKTPLLFEGEPAEGAAGRAAAARWLVATGRQDDILLGYEPVYLGAWERGFSRLVVARADPKLAAKALERAPKPLGRGVWILSAYDVTNADNRHEIPLRLPRPAAAFEARVFGPYLVLRSRERVVTPERYLRLAAAAMVVGKSLGVGDADVNFETISKTAERLGYSASPSASSGSTSSR